VEPVNDAPITTADPDVEAEQETALEEEPAEPAEPAALVKIYDKVADNIPTGLRIAAGVSWRILLIAAALWLLAKIYTDLATLTVPMSIALLLSALLAPLVGVLVRWGVPRGIATAIAIMVGIAAVSGVMTLIVTTFISGLPEMSSQVQQSFTQISDWLRTGPLHLRQEQLQTAINTVTNWLKSNTSSITSSALTTVGTVGEILTGTVLTIFIMIFFLYDGRQIWGFVLKIVPTDTRGRVNVAGRRGFSALVSYIRATVAVAAVDAIGIGTGIAILGVPLAVPLACLVFLGAFIPIIGSLIAGSVAVLVALVTKSFVTALITLAIVVGVMQLESHVLQPLLMGRAVKIHALAVVLGIAVGLELYGIPGALLAVPLIAILNAGTRSLVHDPDLEPHTVNPLRTRNAHAVGHKK
jgi:predicted PurR-regulated permease PerM